ncbi:Chemotaxis protein CheY [Sulfitobacter sp. DSM 110093]|uniref:response regulator n=1 Tax=Sulfitobacter sp. DSM 110093 TaxID=2883127 RepID=UPI001FAE1ADB|nr:response regulator [Sulfitobacter sp. DSM 110093]UOA30463.1 Chemotaxis protein CheY [Sulfitobacter sp. DSM 110093]
MNLNAVVVDDCDIARQLIQASLAEVGFTCVAEYECPARALDDLTNQCIATDIIITDFMMPAMDGLEFCSSVRRLPFYQGVPVVMISTRKNDDLLRRALAAGASDCLKKPFSLEELETRLQLCMQNARQPDQ